MKLACRQQAVRDGSTNEKLPKLEGGGRGAGRGGAGRRAGAGDRGGVGGGRSQGAKTCNQGVDRGVSETALQGAQIHWKKRNFNVGPWGSSRGSHRRGGGQAARFGGGHRGNPYRGPRRI